MTVCCAAFDCKYNNDKCRCTAQTLNLSSHSIMTVWEGRQDFLKCKNYEISDEAKRIMEQTRQFMEETK